MLRCGPYPVKVEALRRAAGRGILPIGMRESSQGTDGAGMEAERPAEPGIAQGTAPFSQGARIVIAVALAGIAVTTMIHLGMVFLHVAPSNTMSKNQKQTLDDWVYPEFEQNWKLFAPNPLQQNVHVHARAEIRKPDGSREMTGWVNLSAQDAKAIDHHPAPSHTQQNELRRAWDFYSNSHDNDHQAIGPRGELSEKYLRRIVMLRFGTELNGGTVKKIQVRGATTPVAPPSWSNEKIDLTTRYDEQPWWRIISADVPRGAGQK